VLEGGLALQDDSELGCFPFRELIDLLAFRCYLRPIQLLLGLAGQIGAATHRDRTGHCLGKTGDDDQRTGRVSGSHASHDPERDEQTVLGAEDELTDPRQPPDSRRLPERMLGDVSLGLGTNIVDRRHAEIIADLPRRADDEH